MTTTTIPASAGRPDGAVGVPITVPQTLAEVDVQREITEVSEMMIIRKALEGDDPAAYVVAKRRLEELQGIATRSPTNQKTYQVDPTDGTYSQGFREPLQVSHSLLRQMARTPVLKAIIGTRIEQVAAFCVPQSDPYSVGFVIEKIPPPGADKAPKMSKADRLIAAQIQEAVLNCGLPENAWHGDGFESWMRKTLWDSLTLDADCTEWVQSRRGAPTEFIAVDGATIRFADTREYEANPIDRREGLYRIRDQSKLRNGYWPTYVQLYQGIPVAEFYPWELSFGIRNATTEIIRGGYGISELEDLIQTVTALLNASTYNANQFRVGAFPRGMLTWEGEGAPDEGKLAKWRREWQMLIAGAENAGRVPVLPAGFKFQDLEKNNRDMEYQEFLEFLIRLACAAYKIDPEETNLAASTPGGGKAIFEGNNEARLKHSRDKGLVPLLRFKEAQINKFFVKRLNPGFRLRFVGIDALTRLEEIELITKRGAALNTVNELRAEKSLPPLPGGDIILSPVYLQSLGMMQSDAAAAEGEGDEQGAGDDPKAGAQGAADDDGMGEDPFEKALNDSLRLTFKRR